MAALIETIEENLRKHEIVLQSFPKTEMGLIPDHIKATEAYKVAKQGYAIYWEKLRAYNKEFAKNHKCIGYECVNGKRVAIYVPKTKKAKTL